MEVCLLLATRSEEAFPTQLIMIFLPRKTAEMGIDIRSEREREACGAEEGLMRLWAFRGRRQGQDRVGGGWASGSSKKGPGHWRILQGMWAPGSTGDHTALMAITP